MKLTVYPSILTGETALPSSKSVAHRALIAAACSNTPCLIKGTFVGDDVFATVSCLEKLGAKIDKTDKGLFVVPMTRPARRAELNVGASGSTLRFMLPLCAAAGTETTFSGTERLSDRPIDGLLSEMKKHGIKTDADKLPLTISGNMSGGIFTIDASVSSQFISGLLLSLPLTGGGTVIPEGKTVSKSYVDITVSVMRSFGVDVTEDEGKYTVYGKYISPTKYEAESDWSSAAFFALGGATGEGVTLAGLNPNSPQGDKTVLDCFILGGASVQRTDKGITVRKGNPRPFSFNVENCPDAAPTLAVLAALRKGKSVLSGTSRLKIKESDRAEEIIKLLNAFGVEASNSGSEITVYGTGRLQGGGEIELPDDHRIAMVAAIAASAADRPTVLSGVQCVSKSYPTFFNDFNKLGGKTDVLPVF